ncbi:MAG: DeoR/GlpR transcriptional regulator [Salinibacterium sp.]|nr:DeoR/GlpR transcriptional regulator [Salinibacterium sp.]
MFRDPGGQHGITISKVTVSNKKEFVSAEVRREQLARLVGERGFMRVVDASHELGVSEVTVRGDLSALESDARVVRVHGGAMAAGVIPDLESPIESSTERDAAAKRAIGRASARMVASGHGIYLDSGSTAMALAQALVERQDLRDLTIVTSGLTIALALEPAVPRYTVVVTGGTLRPLQHSLVSPFAVPMLEALHLDIAFIGCNGVHAVGGVTNVNLPEAEIKSRVLARAQRRVLIADATKLGRTDLAVIGSLDDFDELVTAGEAGPGIVEGLRAAGLTVERADRVDG